MLTGSRERAPGALPPLHAQAKLPNACKNGATSLVNRKGLDELVDCKAGQAVLRLCDMSLDLSCPQLLSHMTWASPISRLQASLRPSALLAARMPFGVRYPLLFNRLA